jgi:hypothetical protein
MDLMVRIISKTEFLLNIKTNTYEEAKLCSCSAHACLCCFLQKDSSTPSSNSTPGNNNNNNSNTITINSTPQFSGTINGTNYSLVNGATYSSGVSSNKLIGSPSNASYASMIGNVNTNQPYFTIYKGTIVFTGSTPDTSAFDAFFPVSAISFSQNNVNGIDIDWIDPSGNLYSTSFGSASQSGSAFTILAKQVSTIAGYQNVKVFAKFNCTLYNSAGASFPLTNGIYVGYFEND